MRIPLPSIILAITIASALEGCVSSRYSKELSDDLTTEIKTLQEEAPVIEGEVIHNPDVITQLYEKGGTLLSAKWNNVDKITQMMSAIRSASQEGLRPEDYHLSDIEKLTDRIISSDEVRTEDIASLELLLTDAFLVFSSHLAAGKTDPETIDPQWKVVRRTIRQNWDSFIDSTLMSGYIFETLHNLSPAHADYYNLKKALATYRRLEEEGGWESFNTSLPKLEKGMRNPDIALLRKRIAVTEGLIASDTIDADYFDQTLHDRVKLFQQKNSLTVDGIVGKSTIEALNIPVEERIATIIANLERWRWINDNLGERYIRVNIANFGLQVMEGDTQVFSSLAIVGRLYRETPVFSSVMRYLVLNPVWTVPETILKEDIIPAMIKNPEYLAEKKMKVFSTNGTEVDPLTIDWNNALTKGFPYAVKQEPGPFNSLGKVKFMFPNQYDVYIHDFPSRSLFLQSIRAFSSGCIRILKPLELAQLLLKDDPAWSPEKVREAMNTGLEQSIVLPKSIPVHILYLTAWATDDGTVFFGKDIYNRDWKLIDALNEIPPEPGQ